MNLITNSYLKKRFINLIICQEHMIKISHLLQHVLAPMEFLAPTEIE